MAETKTATKEVEKTVRVIIPIDKTNNADVFVSVNERTWLIKRGEEVEVPECVAEVLRNQQLQENAAYRFRDANENK